jgi:hypothetical protein
MKCADKRCISGLPAKWRPTLLLWAPGKSKAHIPIDVTVNTHICDSCKKFAKPHHFLSPDLRQKIALHCIEARKQIPDFTTAALTFTMEDSANFLITSGERLK